MPEKKARCTPRSRAASTLRGARPQSRFINGIRALQTGVLQVAEPQRPAREVHRLLLARWYGGGNAQGKNCCIISKRKQFEIILEMIPK